MYVCMCARARMCISYVIMVLVCVCVCVLLLTPSHMSFVVSWYSQPRYRKLRASMFVGMACMGVFPMIHMVFHNGLENKV